MNDKEMAKCEAMIAAVNHRSRDQDRPVPPGYTKYEELPQLSCFRGADQFDCMQKISENEADLVQLEPGLGYTGGEYFNMLPLAAERYDLGSGDTGFDYYAVAVVRRDRPDINIDNLASRKACHTGVGRAAGWVYPVSNLMQMEKMPIEQCNVPVKSAAAYFGDMCAPGGLARFYNPFGNNPVSVCENCQGDIETFCTSNDPYAGYEGAFECMASGDGEVAFVRDSTIMQATANTTRDASDYELLCLDGTRRAYDQAAGCNWGKINSHIVMTSAIRDAVVRTEYINLIRLLSYDFGAAGAHTDLFRMFESMSYGRANLMFTDETKELVNVAEVGDGSRNTYYGWVGEDHRERLLSLNMCPVRQARWCVISDMEMSKCEDMIMAFAAKALKPDLNCIQGRSVRDCMERIRMGDADMITLDAADVYVAGRTYNLVPIAAEDYSGYDSATYYAVAVARRTDSFLTIFNLKQRRTCHSAVWTAAGWIIPVDKLIETGQIRVQTCNPYFNVGQFFSKSCVPGVLEDHYNTYGTNPPNLCEACAAGGNDRCARNNVELYYGNSGAFRCLAENGGDVAFVKHTTARENTDGRNIAEWARNRRADDYELLCNDGTRKDIDSWADCNMGEVPSNAIVTASFKSQKEREIYWTLLNFAQQFFASDTNDDFTMFGSMLDHKDLIFQDSTVRLVEVTEEKQTYQEYLGERFMRAMQRMETIDCITDSATSLNHFTSFTILFIVLVVKQLL